MKLHTLQPRITTKNNDVFEKIGRALHLPNFVGICVILFWIIGGEIGAQPYYEPRDGQTYWGSGPWISLDRGQTIRTFEWQFSGDGSPFATNARSETITWDWYRGGTNTGRFDNVYGALVNQYSYNPRPASDFVTEYSRKWTRTSQTYVYALDFSFAGYHVFETNAIPQDEVAWGKFEFSITNKFAFPETDVASDQVETFKTDCVFTLKTGIPSHLGRTTKFIRLYVQAYEVGSVRDWSQYWYSNGKLVPFQSPTPVPFDKILVGTNRLNADYCYFFESPNANIPLPITVDGITNYILNFQVCDTPTVSMNRAFHAFLLTNNPTEISLPFIQARFDDGTRLLGQDQDDRIPDSDPRVSPPTAWVARTNAPGVSVPVGAGPEYFTDHVPSYVQFVVTDARPTPNEFPTNSFFPLDWQGTNYQELRFFNCENEYDLTALLNANFAQLKLVQTLPPDVLAMGSSVNGTIVAGISNLTGGVLIHEWLHTCGLLHRGEYYGSTKQFGVYTSFVGNNPSANPNSRFLFLVSRDPADEDAIMYPVSGPTRVKLNRHERGCGLYPSNDGWLSPPPSWIPSEVTAAPGSGYYWSHPGYGLWVWPYSPPIW